MKLLDRNFAIQRTTYVWSNGKCIKPEAIFSVTRNNTKKQHRPTINQIYFRFHRIDLLVGLLHSQLDLPLVFLVGPGEFGALDICLNAIMVRQDSPRKMQRCRLTMSETYKPPTPVMVNIPGLLVGLTVKICPKEKNKISEGLELLLKDAEAEICQWTTHSIWRNGSRSVCSSDDIFVFVLCRTSDVVVRTLAFEAAVLSHGVMKSKGWEAGGLEG